MGKRGPKPTREPTTHIRVPISLAEALRSSAKAQGRSIASLLENLKDTMLALLPMPPSKGPPLPRGMGIRWQGQSKKERKGQK